MRPPVLAALVAVWLGMPAGPVAAQIMPPVKDPAVTSRDLLKKLETEGAEPFTAELFRLLRNANPKSNITDQIRSFGKKAPDVSGIVHDRNYNDLVRVILFYAQYDDGRYPFVYYHFTYKMTKAGWALTNFRFESETSRAFPEGYTEP